MSLITETQYLADRLDEAGFSELADAFRKANLEIGQSYLFRCVTYFWVGKLVAITPKFFVLEDASWVSDTGRFHDALRDGFDKVENSQIEPAPGYVHVLIDGTIDICGYPHDLNIGQK